MIIGRLKAILYLFFVIVPFFINSALELIVIRGCNILDFSFKVNKIKVKKKKIDKQKFGKLMERICK